MQSYRAPKDIRNLAVKILVDESASMSDKVVVTRDTCVTLYEALEELRIPVAVTGFTSNDRYSQSLHHHFGTWHHTARDKTALASINAYHNNYDYIAISEAALELDKHPAKHKVLIVLSDGVPCTMDDMSYSDATAFTKKAIDDARSKGIAVVGIGIEAQNPIVYAAMYGKDFVTTRGLEELPAKVADVLQEVVKRWA